MNTTETQAIEVNALEKSFRGIPVLNRLSFSVARGTVFALLGPNGAGKTTTVRILATLLGADGGEVRVAAFELRTQRHEVRKRISLTGQYAAVDALQTATENLWTIARLAGLSRRASRRRAAELLERFGLERAADRRVGTYSGGMRRRLDLAASLISNPEILFLDEPTTGLDPASRLELWNVVGELVASGVTVLLTTQYLEEAERLADRIAVLDGGRIVAEGTAEDLKRRIAEDRLELRLDPQVSFAEFRRRLNGSVLEADPSERALTLRTEGGAREVRALLDELDPDGTAWHGICITTHTRRRCARGDRARGVGGSIRPADPRGDHAPDRRRDRHRRILRGRHRPGHRPVPRRRTGVQHG
jgi:ABC-2 type transport system ATP-binding protein